MSKDIRLVFFAACMWYAVGATAAGPEIEEVIVSARKVNERLQDVPVAVTAIGGEQLTDRGAVDIKDVLGSVPGLSFSDAELGKARYAIRGVSTTVSSPTVGVYLDDISLNVQGDRGVGSFDAILFDVDRLEVLKGPQGTLYGAGAMGGAIKYVSARPNLSDSAVKVAAGMGTTAHGSESYKAEGVLNLPLATDVLAVRAGLLYRHDGGFIDNVAGADIEDTTYSSTPAPTYTPLVQPSLSTASKEDYNFSDTYVGRVSLLWQPDASWSIRPMAIYQESRAENPPYFHTNLPGLASSYRFVDNKTIDRAGIYSLDISKRWGGVELTSVTAYVDRDTTWQRDYSFFVGSLVPPLYPFSSFAHYPTQFKTFSQELRIASAPDPKSRLSWVAGLYYSTQDWRFTGIVPIINGTQSIFGTDIGFTLDSKSEQEQSAAFGELTYAITDALDVTAGLRVFDISQNSHNVGDGPFNNGFSENRSDIDEDGVNPKVGVSYKLGADHLLYASAAKGFRPGGSITEVFPSPLCDADLARLGYSSAPKQYDSDDLWTYEIGSKNELNGNAVINGSVFYTDWKDIQQNLTLPNCGRAITTNAGAAEIRGVELEAQIRPTSGLEFSANATYTDAEITDPGFGGGARKGDEILSVPKWMAGVYGSYSTPLTDSWNVTFRTDYQYRGRQRNTFNRVQAVRFVAPDGTYPFVPNGEVPFATQFQESYDILNASLSLDNGPTSARLYVANLLDERPHLDTPLGIVFGSSFSTTLRPRTIGFEIRQEF